MQLMSKVLVLMRSQDQAAKQPATASFIKFPNPANRRKEMSNNHMDEIQEDKPVRRARRVTSATVKAEAESAPKSEAAAETKAAPKRRTTKKPAEKTAPIPAQMNPAPRTQDQSVLNPSPKLARSVQTPSDHHSVKTARLVETTARTSVIVTMTVEVTHVTAVVATVTATAAVVLRKRLSQRFTKMMS